MDSAFPGAVPSPRHRRGSSPSPPVKRQPHGGSLASYASHASHDGTSDTASTGSFGGLAGGSRASFGDAAGRGRATSVIRSREGRAPMPELRGWRTSSRDNVTNFIPSATGADTKVIVEAKSGDNAKVTVEAMVYEVDEETQQPIHDASVLPIVVQTNTPKSLGELYIRQKRFRKRQKPLPYHQLLCLSLIGKVRGRHDSDPTYYYFRIGAEMEPPLLSDASRTISRDSRQIVVYFPPSVELPNDAVVSATVMTEPPADEPSVVATRVHSFPPTPVVPLSSSLPSVPAGSQGAVLELPLSSVPPQAMSYRVVMQTSSASGAAEPSPEVTSESIYVNYLECDVEVRGVKPFMGQHQDITFVPVDSPDEHTIPANVGKSVREVVVSATCSQHGVPLDPVERVLFMPEDGSTPSISLSSLLGGREGAIDIVISAYLRQPGCFDGAVTTPVEDGTTVDKMMGMVTYYSQREGPDAYRLITDDDKVQLIMPGDDEVWAHVPNPVPGMEVEVVRYGVGPEGEVRREEVQAQFVATPAEDGKLELPVPTKSVEFRYECITRHSDSSMNIKPSHPSLSGRFLCNMPAGGVKVEDQDGKHWVRVPRDPRRPLPDSGVCIKVVAVCDDEKAPSARLQSAVDTVGSGAGVGAGGATAAAAVSLSRRVYTLEVYATHDKMRRDQPTKATLVGPVYDPVSPPDFTEVLKLSQGRSLALQLKEEIKIPRQPGKGLSFTILPLPDGMSHMLSFRQAVPTPSLSHTGMCYLREEDVIRVTNTEEYEEKSNVHWELRRGDKATQNTTDVVPDYDPSRSHMIGFPLSRVSARGKSFTLHAFVQHDEHGQSAVATAGPFLVNFKLPPVGLEPYDKWLLPEQALELLIAKLPLDELVDLRLWWTDEDGNAFEGEALCIAVSSSSTQRIKLPDRPKARLRCQLTHRGCDCSEMTVTDVITIGAQNPKPRIEIGAGGSGHQQQYFSRKHAPPTIVFDKPEDVPTDAILEVYAFAKSKDDSHKPPRELTSVHLREVLTDAHHLPQLTWPSEILGDDEVMCYRAQVIRAGTYDSGFVETKWAPLDVKLSGPSLRLITDKDRPYDIMDTSKESFGRNDSMLEVEQGKTTVLPNTELHLCIVECDGEESKSESKTGEPAVLGVPYLADLGRDGRFCISLADLLQQCSVPAMSSITSFRVSARYSHIDALSSEETLTGTIRYNFRLPGLINDHPDRKAVLGGDVIRVRGHATDPRFTNPDGSVLVPPNCMIHVVFRKNTRKVDVPLDVPFPADGVFALEVSRSWTGKRGFEFKLSCPGTLESPVLAIGPIDANLQLEPLQALNNATTDDMRKDSQPIEFLVPASHPDGAVVHVETFINDVQYGATQPWKVEDLPGRVLQLPLAGEAFDKQLVRFQLHSTCKDLRDSDQMSTKSFRVNHVLPKPGLLFDGADADIEAEVASVEEDGEERKESECIIRRRLHQTFRVQVGDVPAGCKLTVVELDEHKAPIADSTTHGDFSARGYHKRSLTSKDTRWIYAVLSHDNAIPGEERVGPIRVSEKLKAPVLKGVSPEMRSGSCFRVEWPAGVPRPRRNLSVRVCSNIEPRGVLYRFDDEDLEVEIPEESTYTATVMFDHPFYSTKSETSCTGEINVDVVLGEPIWTLEGDNTVKVRVPDGIRPADRLRLKVEERQPRNAADTLEEEGGSGPTAIIPSIHDIEPHQVIVLEPSAPGVCFHMRLEHRRARRSKWVITPTLGSSS